MRQDLAEMRGNRISGVGVDRSRFKRTLTRQGFDQGNSKIHSFSLVALVRWRTPPRTENRRLAQNMRGWNCAETRLCASVLGVVFYGTSK
ncbi:hypothetical protein BOTBODRAFT_348096 [Botryobasidium botryosum FD-172 SS1]|uniref:Uncharacterized protein n=1 Tax=Botryobasidium botryosum (strain FD-172 SS1) TaxID=930990 RepID=A0A067MRT7_BOTB1|nr:hypothetical protein BOTBODRAFT_348096 [Botryobasidium botryosum FD-172 SS1]